MLTYFLFKKLADRQRQIEFDTYMRKVTTKQFAFSVSFLERKIAYYKQMNFQKGTIESIEWVEHYIHSINCKPKWQSKMDNLATELIILTFRQTDIYKLYEYQRTQSIGLSIEKFLLEQRHKLISLKRQREFEIKVDSCPKPVSIYERRLNQAIKKEQEITIRNEKEKSLMASLDEEKLSKVNAIGNPTLKELMAQGIIESLFSETDFVNVAVHCKIYGKYYLVVSCRERYNITGSSYIAIPYANREDAINDMEKYFQDEIKLSKNYKEEQLKKTQKREKQINNSKVDISNVTKAMGLTESDEDLDGNIF